MPGQKWSDCGLLETVMSGCQTMEVSKDGHSVTLRQKDTVLWKMSSSSKKNTNNRKGVPSLLHVDNQGQVVMLADNKVTAFNQVTVLEKPKDSSTSWPFEVTPPVLRSMMDHTVLWFE